MLITTQTRNLTYAIIKVYYTDNEVNTLELIESTLRLYKYNTSSNLWNEIIPGGIDTDQNYVWGNITKFSLFGVFWRQD